MTSGALGPSRARVWIALVSLWLIWGSTYLGTVVLTESAPVYLSVSSRFIIAGVILVAYLAIRDRAALRVTRRQLASSAFLGFSFLGWSLGILAVAMHYVPTGEAALLVSVLPVWIVIIRMVTHDRPAWQTILGVIIGVVGLAWMLLPGGSDTAGQPDSQVVWWSLVIVVSSITWAVTSWLSPRLPTPENGLVSTAYQSLFGAAVLLAIGLARGERWDIAATSTSSWIALLYLAVIGSIFGWLAFVWLLKNASLSLMSTYAYVNPVVAVVLGLLFHGESMSSDVIIGCTVVLAGVVLVVSGERRGARVTS